MKYQFTAILLLMASLSWAQKWHYGPKLDLNLSQIEGKGMNDRFLPGVQIGGFAQYVLNKQWSIQPELLYTGSNVQKDDKFIVYYNNNIGRTNAREKMQLGAISVPVLIRYEIAGKFSLLAGPQYSYIFYTDENLLKSNADAFKKTEVSVNAGGQFNLGDFTLSVRYNKGISDINDIDNRYKWTSNHILIGCAVKIK